MHTNYTQIVLDLGDDWIPKRKLINGQPTFGQRYNDWIDEGFSGNILDFARWESEQENRIALKLGFLCGSDYELAKYFKLSKDEFYSQYSSCLVKHPSSNNYTPPPLSDDLPKRKWSDEAKFRVRVNRLKKRVARKYSIPSMFEEALNNALYSNPDYYGIKS